MIPGIAGLGGRSGGSSNFVRLTDQSIIDSNPSGISTAEYTVGSDRNIKDQDGAVLETWLAGGSAATYQVRATVDDVTPAGDSTGVWLSCSSSRSWSISSAGTPPPLKTCTLQVEIRDAAAPNTVRASATIRLLAGN